MLEVLISIGDYLEAGLIHAYLGVLWILLAVVVFLSGSMMNNMIAFKGWRGNEYLTCGFAPPRRSEGMRWTRHTYWGLWATEVIILGLITFRHCMTS